MAALAKEHGDSLFVFPGGRLDCQDEYEYLRNSIYSLVNKQNLDALVSWGSSLGGSASLEEVRAFHERFEEIPYVTYSLKRPGHPDIGFDAYSGMQGVLAHCILHHGSKRIAFLRGPENHQGAQDRYRAYLDTLKQCGLPIDEKLVTDPFAWHDGAKAFKQLTEVRGLVPGKDFDTLSCSSDMMMFAAGKILEEQGYSIPEDLRLVGFNDTEESLLLKVPCTTVHMPVQEMASMSYSMVTDILEKSGNGDADILLPAPLVIRGSCGCPNSLGSYQKAKELFTSIEAFSSWLEKTFPGEYPHLKLLLEKKEGKHIEQIFYSYLRNGGDVLLADEAINWYSDFFVKDSQLDTELRKILLRQKDLVDREHSYELHLESKKLNSLKSALLCSRSIKGISEICKDNLPALGIESCYIVLHQDSQSLFVGGFDSKHYYEDSVFFSTVRLLPDFLEGSLPCGIYVVEPLFMENQPLGYLVVETNSYSGSLIEELRTSISSAIKGTLLLDAANRAREMAERAQRTRSEFLANISEGLRDPLEEILLLTRDSNKRVQVKQQISKANHLLDLTLSQTGALELNYKVLSLKEGLPVVKLDKERMDQLIASIEESIDDDGGRLEFSAEVTEKHLAFTLSSSVVSWKASLHRQDPGFSLAERLILMHGGSFELRGNQVVMGLPWPTIGSEAPMVHPLSGNIPYFIGDEPSQMPKLFDSLQYLNSQAVVQDPKVLASCSLIVLDGSLRSFPMQLAFHMVSNDVIGQKIPVLCLNCPQGYDSIADALESGYRGIRCGAIFTFGPLPSGLEKLGIPSDFIALKELAQFEKFSKQQSPSLLICSVFDVSSLIEIRKQTQVPFLVVSEKFDSSQVEKIGLLPKVIIANSCACDSDEFIARLANILCGEEILPPLTGVLVKRAVAYLNKYATTQISRWQLAEAVNVSEDYLTRIFRKELGISPWDYLNRYRIHIATQLLRQTSLTINEVASQSGFQDQAYFCRVFKKTLGCNPGKIRQGEKKSSL